MTPSSSEALSQALAVLRRGGLIALPTETVYGLAADAENELAVRRIFAVKRRPSSHPLIVHVGSVQSVQSWVSAFPKEAMSLAEAFWPGPLTLVLPRSDRASDAVTGGQDTVAVRVPSHPLARSLLQAFGGGVAAPSANRFGRISPTCAEHVRADLGADVDLVLDGGPAAVGVESTIVDVSGTVPALLRPGGVPQEALERVLGRPLPLREAGEVRVPGLLPSHYAPRAGLLIVPEDRLCAEATEQLTRGLNVAVLASNAALAPAGTRFVAIPDDNAALARRLYALLRDVDALNVDVMVMALPDPAGLGLAVRDRLLRASAPRVRGV